MALYTFGIWMYYAAIRVASLFHPKAEKWVQGRKNILPKIETATASFEGQTLWVHCASLGEFEMARPIIKHIKYKKATVRVVLTFFSPSGYEVIKHYTGADHVFYLPLDTPSNAQRFVTAIKPSTVIFVKYDLWYHHLYQAHKHGAELLLISAQFRPSQQYFKFYGLVARRALRLFHQIFLVDSASRQLLHQIGVENTMVCGDTRYDRVMQVAQNSEEIQAINRFKNNAQLIVCGSTWPADEKILAACVQAFPAARWVIAPHEVNETTIARLQKLLPQAERLSTLENENGNVLIVDAIGLLSKIYRYADVAYVGGAFSDGLHNILEATAFGTPTIFGPDFSRFPDAGEMVQKGLAFSIKNQEELTLKLGQLLMEEQTPLRSRITAFMRSRTGATKAILEYTRVC